MNPYLTAHPHLFLLRIRDPPQMRSCGPQSRTLTKSAGMSMAYVLLSETLVPLVVLSSIRRAGIWLGAVAS
jgi:hypothetical protein